jgi:negative regulator of flagellin synthesis FlgM
MNIKSNKPPENKASNDSAQDTPAVYKTGNFEEGEKTAQAEKAPLDRMDLSGRSKKIADITSALDRFPETRDARVREIKQRVDAGTYSVDPHKVAESILKSLCAIPRTSYRFDR